MTTKITYQVELTGTETAAEQLAALNASIAKTGGDGGKLGSIIAGAADQMGNTFKSVSRDVDVLGGQIAATATKATSDLLGLVAAIGTGGLGAALAVAGAAVGGAITLWGAWEKQAQDAIKANTEAVKGTKAWVDQMTAAFIAGEAAITAQSLAAQNAAIKARALADAQMILDEALLRQAADGWRTSWDGYATFIKKTEEADALAARRKEFNIQTEVIKREQAADQMTFLGEAFQKGLTEAQEKATKLREAAEDAAGRRAVDKRKALMDALGKAQLDGQAKADRDFAEIQEKQRKDGEDYETQFQKSIGNLDELIAADAKAGADNAVKASEKATEALNKRTEAERKLAEQIEERQRKQNQADAASLQSAVVNESYAASLMVVNAAMGPLNAQLQKFGTINRENWRDLLLFTEDSKAAFAAQVQAALWSLAQQAGSKATMEAGEAVKETALAFGAYAIHDYGGAGLHAASAATHTVAAQVYAGIAGTSAGASAGIGMARGEGGLVGLTKEEREAKDREIGTRTAGDSAGGPVAGVGRAERAGPVVVNFVYEAGAINAQNRDAAAATVASATRHARRDGFRRREMGG